MKIYRLLGLLGILGTLLLACTSDGRAYLYIPFRKGNNEVATIRIVDDYQFNSIHVNFTIKQVFCGDGSVIQLPEETLDYEVEYDDVEIDVRTVCEMGQEKFDTFLSVFELVSTGR